MTGCIIFEIFITFKLVGLLFSEINGSSILSTASKIYSVNVFISSRSGTKNSKLFFERHPIKYLIHLIYRSNPDRSLRKSSPF